MNETSVTDDLELSQECRLKDLSSDLLLINVLRACQKIETRVEAELAHVGISLAKLGVLAHLVDSGEPLPLGRLAEKISCVKSNITQLIDRMEADGLVTRVSDSIDRRCIRAAITDEGQTRFEIGNSILHEAEQRLLGLITNEEHQRLLNVLSRIVNE